MAEDLEAAANQNEGKGSRGRRRRRRERKIRNRIISELPSYAKKQEEKEDGEADSSSSDDSDEEENEGIHHITWPIIYHMGHKLWSIMQWPSPNNTGQFTLKFRYEPNSPLKPLFRSSQVYNFIWWQLRRRSSTNKRIK